MNTKAPPQQYEPQEEYWMVDPKTKTVHAFLLQPNGKYDFGTVYECTQKAPVHIFEGLKIDLKELFNDV